jgi:hypothetical protein
MMKVDKTQRIVTLLPTSTLAKVGLQERGDFQKMFIKCAEVFMEEMGENFLIVAEELLPSDEVADRLDLLAVDPYGAVVVIELKRNENKLQLLQSLTYASMMSGWEPEKLIDLLAEFKNIDREQAQRQLEDFVEGGIEQINQVQRIILIAEDFDFSVLSTAEWLRENYEVDIRCYKVKLAAEGQAIFLSAQCILPATGIAEQAVRRGRRVGTSKVYKSWDEVLEGVENKAVSAFFPQEVAAGQENRLKTGPEIKYRVNGKPPWSVAARVKFASIWQEGRFDRDDAFWKAQLGPTADVRQVNDNKCLAFNLVTADQFAAFKAAVTGELAAQDFKGQ